MKKESTFRTTCPAFFRRFPLGSLVPLVLVAGMVTGADAQEQTPPASSAQQQSAPAQAASTPATTSAATPAGDVEVPAGTKVLLALHSGIDTKTAQPGDGVYLASTFPVVVGNRVVIPAGVYVQGVIDKVVRPGRVKGRAEVQMHFTTIIFPNGSVVSIPGVVNALPGSADARVTNSEGQIERSNGSHIDPGTVATGAATGAGVGGIAGAASGHAVAGLGYGALAGGVGGAIYSLFTRNNDLTLEQGQTIEMVLQRPLELQEANLTGVTGSGPVPVPQSEQQLPMEKPRHEHILCPVDAPGCT
jgi:hypothetical protein